MTTEDRRESAVKKKRGTCAILMKCADQKIVIDDVEYDEVYVRIASENEAIRTSKDVKEYMNENDMLGTVYAARLNVPITRVVQKIAKFS